MLEIEKNVIELQKIQGKYAFGAYGDVFFSEDGKFATKVFRRRKDASESHMKNVFDSEVNAYKLAGKSDELTAITPKFFGVAKCLKITEENGLDISKDFHLEYAYQMQYVKGAFKKLGSLSSSIDTSFIQTFHDAGILHTCDASVLVSSANVVECVIDFAVKEYVLEH